MSRNVTSWGQIIIPQMRQTTTSIELSKHQEREEYIDWELERKNLKEGKNRWIQRQCTVAFRGACQGVGIYIMYISIRDFPYEETHLVLSDQPQIWHQMHPGHRRLLISWWGQILVIAWYWTAVCGQAPCNFGNIGHNIWIHTQDLSYREINIYCNWCYTCLSRPNGGLWVELSNDFLWFP